MKTVTLLFLCFVTGCSSHDHSTGKHIIKCTKQVGDCHERARSLCPDGYLVTNRVRPTQVDGETEYRLNVKCRSKALY